MDVFFPPGPQKSLLLGNAPQIARDPLRFIADAARQYGDIVHLRIGPSHAYLVSNPAYAHYVLVERSDRFSDTPRLFRAINSAFGHDLIPPKDTIQKRPRPRPLFQPRWLDDTVDRIAALTADTLAGWPDGDQREIVGEFSRLTLRLMARVVLDTTATDMAARIGEALDFSRELADRGFRSPLALPIWIPGWRRSPVSPRALRTLIDTLIEQYRAGARGQTGLLARLIAEADGRGPTGALDAQVRDEAAALFLAGQQTVAHTLAWACYLLARNPEAEATLRAEVDAALGQRPITVDDLSALPYTVMVIRETLRLYPPAWLLSRQATMEIRLGNYYLPSGSTVFVSPYITQRSPRHFPDPEAFIPERFLEGYERRIPRHAYMPFGAGWRASLEEAVTLRAVTVMLATLVQRVTLALEPDFVVAPQPGLTLRPRDGLPMRVAARRSEALSA